MGKRLAGHSGVEPSAALIEASAATPGVSNGFGSVVLESGQGG
jgi:hypothetical protein